MLTASMGPTKECLGSDRGRKERSQQPEEVQPEQPKADSQTARALNENRTLAVRSITACQKERNPMQNDQLSLNSFRNDGYPIIAN
jgi:hypothetical protein